MAKKNGNGNGNGNKATDLAVAANPRAELARIAGGEYAIMLTEPSEFGEIMAENLGPRGFDVFTLDRVGVPAGGGRQWIVPSVEGEKLVDTIRGVIIYWQDVRVYWSTAFGEGSAVPPDCSSTDCITGSGLPGGSCDTCEFSQFGSAKGGEGAGQACKECRRLFVITEQERLPLLINLPPTSLKGVRRYFQRIASRGKSYYGVVSDIGLVGAQNAGGIKYSQAVITICDELTDPQVNAFRELSKIFRPSLSTIPVASADYSGIASSASASASAGDGGAAGPWPGTTVAE